MLTIALGRVLQFLLLFATIKISTTLLTPAEMAKVYLVITIVALYAMLLLNPVGMFMNRRLYAWNAAGKAQHYYNYFWLYLIVVCGLAVVSLRFFIDVGWIELHTTTGQALLLVGGSLLITTANQVVIPGLNLLGYRGWFVALTLASVAASLIAATIFVVKISYNAENWIYGLLFGQLIFAVLGWKIFFSKLNVCHGIEKPTKQHIGILFEFAWPISIAVGLGWAQTQSYRFLMESNLGLHSLGLFAAGYGISAGLISATESIFTAYLQPIFYKRISNENLIDQAKAWSDYSETIIPSLLLLGFFILTTTTELTRVMLGPEYFSSSQFIMWGVIAELARVAVGIYAMVAHARMKTRLLLLPSFVGATLSVGLIWWLMPIYGSNGVGAGLVLSAVIAFGFIYVATRREFVRKFPRKMVMTSILMGCCLFLLAEVSRWVINGIDSLFASLALLFVVGVMFLLFQYILLRRLFHGDRIDE